MEYPVCARYRVVMPESGRHHAGELGWTAALGASETSRRVRQAVMDRQAACLVACGGQGNCARDARGRCTVVQRLIASLQPDRDVGEGAEAVWRRHVGCGPAWSG